MVQLDTRKIVDRLRTIESLAVIPRVASTNLIARRIVAECIENELSLPQAMIVAGEQFAGIGRNARTWSSPPGKGIYATTLLTRSVAELPLIPLEIANMIATFLRDTFSIDARIKWPNDVLAGGKKIAGILCEARIQDERAFLLIGTGINVEPVEDETRPNAVAITELSPGKFPGIEAATESFIVYLDACLGRRFDREAIIDEWRRLTVHRSGDPITCVLGERTVSGRWDGIDDRGRALLQNGDETIAVSAGEIMLS